MEIISTTVSTILTMIRHDVAHVICNISEQLVSPIWQLRHVGKGADVLLNRCAWVARKVELGTGWLVRMTLLLADGWRQEYGRSYSFARITVVVASGR